MRRFTLVCDDRQARRVERLATQYGLTEREVLRQLIDLGLDSLDPEEETADGKREDPLPDD
ncbi:MAG: CopG family transcriptional regulator [Haloarculaceae archaeon]